MRTLIYTGGSGVDDVTLGGTITTVIVSLGADDDFFTYGATFTAGNPLAFFAFINGGADNDTFDGSLVGADVNDHTFLFSFETIIV